MKWCVEYNVTLDWNLLFGFPGETREDYVEMIELFKQIRFLKPPTAYGPIRLDRFSPYHNNPADFGMVNVRPLAPYRYLYPFDEQSLMNIAYYFDFDYSAGEDPTGFAAEAVQYVIQWQREPEIGTLCSITRPDGALTLIDTRSDAVLPELTLTGLEQAGYEFCDEIHSGSAVAAHLRKQFPDLKFTDAQVIESLDSLVANKLMLTDGLHYLSLAVAVRPIEQTSDPVALFETANSPARPASSYLSAEPNSF